jgi:hypothetical protein
MRCYFMKDGHIASVEALPGLSDEQAVKASHQLFSEALQGRFDGFELWDRARVVTRWQAPDGASKAPTVLPPQI